jgi:hypothetical protein
MKRRIDPLNFDLVVFRGVPNMEKIFERPEVLVFRESFVKATIWIRMWIFMMIVATVSKW